MAHAAMTIVPMGEGETKQVSMRLPADLLRRLDACAAETNNDRTRTLIYLTGWALNEWEKEKASRLSTTSR